MIDLKRKNGPTARLVKRAGPFRPSVELAKPSRPIVAGLVVFGLLASACGQITEARGSTDPVAISETGGAVTQELPTDSSTDRLIIYQADPFPAEVPIVTRLGDDRIAAGFRGRVEVWEVNAPSQSGTESASPTGFKRVSAPAEVWELPPDWYYTSFTADGRLIVTSLYNEIAVMPSPGAALEQLELPEFYGRTDIYPLSAGKLLVSGSTGEEQFATGGRLVHLVDAASGEVVSATIDGLGAVHSALELTDGSIVLSSGLDDDGQVIMKLAPDLHQIASVPAPVEILSLTLQLEQMDVGRVAVHGRGVAILDEQTLSTVVVIDSVPTAGGPKTPGGSLTDITYVEKGHYLIRLGTEFFTVDAGALGDPTAVDLGYGAVDPTFVDFLPVRMVPLSDGRMLSGITGGAIVWHPNEP